MQALFEFESGLIGEGDDFHIIRRDSQFNEGGDSMGDDFGFAGAGACDTEASFIGGEGGLSLITIEDRIRWGEEVFKGFILKFFGKERNQEGDFFEHVGLGEWCREGIVSLPYTGN